MMSLWCGDAVNHVGPPGSVPPAPPTPRPEAAALGRPGLAQRRLGARRRPRLLRLRPDRVDAGRRPPRSCRRSCRRSWSAASPASSSTGGTASGRWSSRTCCSPSDCSPCSWCPAPTGSGSCTSSSRSSRSSRCSSRRPSRRFLPRVVPDADLVAGERAQRPGPQPGATPRLRARRRRGGVRWHHRGRGRRTPSPSWSPPC